MQVLYTAAIWLYGAAIRAAAAFKPKARLWVDGRKNDPNANQLEKLQGCIWIHCASLGEFEQGRPVLEHVKRKHPEKPILLTFFSPSGYEIRKNYPLADHVAYMPLDTPSNARAFIKIYTPSVAIFVKYEIWQNFLSALKAHEIPVVLISAMFRKDQIYFKPWGKWFRNALMNMERIFTQDAESVIQLSAIGVSNAIQAGDTRFDRVFKIAQSAGDEAGLATFGKGKDLLIAGSTWEQDELLLLKFFEKHRENFPSLRLVIVPHEVSETHIKRLLSLAPNAQLWTQIKDEDVTSSILIVDTMGMLSQMYKEAKITYVGGGFGSGIHNILEPAAFGLPVIFGPKNHKFKEAQDLLNLGGAFEINNSEELETTILRLLQDVSIYKSACEASVSYVRDNLGATNNICNYLDTLLTKD